MRQTQNLFEGSERGSFKYNRSGRSLSKLKYLVAAKGSDDNTRNNDDGAMTIANGSFESPYQ